jgi:hypothetical protein
LRQRGSVTVWFTDEAIAAWEAEPRTTRGGQPVHSALAILTALTLRAVFHLAYRQAEGLIGSIISLLGLTLCVPDHTTLSRRSATLAVPRLPPTAANGDARRAGSLSSFTADGAYDQDRVYAAVADRHPEVEVIVPPRITAVPSSEAETAPTQRDRHLRCIAENGRMAWQKTYGYNQRAKVEATIGRWKQVIGDGLRSRIDACRSTEVDVAVHALNRMLEMGRPNYVRMT